METSPTAIFPSQLDRIRLISIARKAPSPEPRGRPGARGVEDREGMGQGIQPERIPNLQTTGTRYGQGVD